MIHVDINANGITENHPVDLGVVADPKLTLGLLGDALEEILSRKPAGGGGRTHRHAGPGEGRKGRRRQGQGCQRARQHPLKATAFMEALAAHLPPEKDVMIFDEGLTRSPAVVRYWPPQRTGQYFVTRGGSLGVGIPGAIGAKIANPDKTVIGFTGDGGSMYTIQALWTAARHNVAAKFVVCNNSSYRLLQLNIDQYWKEQGVPKHDYPLSFDLSYPPLGFVDMARGLGVPGHASRRRSRSNPPCGRCSIIRGRSWWNWCWRATPIRSGWGPRRAVKWRMAN